LSVVAGLPRSIENAGEPALSGSLVDLLPATKLNSLLPKQSGAPGTACQVPVCHSADPQSGIMPHWTSHIAHHHWLRGIGSDAVAAENLAWFLSHLRYNVLPKYWPRPVSLYRILP